MPAVASAFVAAPTAWVAAELSHCAYWVATVVIACAALPCQGSPPVTDENDCAAAPNSLPNPAQLAAAARDRPDRYRKTPRRSHLWRQQ